MSHFTTSERCFLHVCSGNPLVTFAAVCFVFGHLILGFHSFVESCILRLHLQSSMYVIICPRASGSNVLYYSCQDVSESLVTQFHPGIIPNYFTE